MRRIIIPARYIKTNKSFKTVATRNKNSGKFTGRANVGGMGDKTSTRYLSQDYDTNHDGKISSEERGGTLLGRNPRIIKASKRARGYIRQI